MIDKKKLTSSYILWLIRNKIATTWQEILKLYDLNHIKINTIHNILDGRINELIKNNLISVQSKTNKKSNKGYKFVFAEPESEVANAQFSVTDNTLNLLTTLGISLEEVANRDSNSILVNPIFSTQQTNKNQFDLFILMPFIEKLKPLYDDHIKNVAKQLKLSVARADDFFTVNSIINDVWQAIYKSKIIVADCSGKNANVFYEIGIAHTIGKPVILITDNRSDMPFDISHIRYIVYEFTPRGMEEFEKNLKTTINQINRL